MAVLKIKWTRSAIGSPADQKRTIEALGFTRLNQTISKEDTPSIRGMLYKVRHLVEVTSED